MKFRIQLICIILLFSRIAFSNPPKNIILFIGDGMGMSHFTVLNILKQNPNINKFTHSALVMNFSYGHAYTDSAAAATAMATGYKTRNGNIGVDQNFREIKSLTSYAEEKGISTGLVCTSSVTHATPAAFFAHNPSRKNYNKIAEDIVSSGIDLLFGGGKSYFIPENLKGSFRKDSKDLISKLKTEMKVIYDYNDFKTISAQDKKIAGFFSSDHLQTAEYRTPSLKEMTETAIKVLSKNTKGFFLLVEASQVDWKAHDNDSSSMNKEILDFDDAITPALDFYNSNKNTLIIVTSDHETGAYAIHGADIKNNSVKKDSFSSKNHTISMVPLLALGSGSDKLTGIIDNTFIGKYLISLINDN